MITLVAQLILVLSLGGILFILINKMPVLVALPEKEDSEGFGKKIKYFFSSVKDRSSKVELPEREAKKEDKFEKEEDYWQKVVE